jgi:hypothetical protein
MQMKSMEHVTVVSVLVRTEMDIGIVQVIRTITSRMHLGMAMMNTNQHHRAPLLNQTLTVSKMKTGFGNFLISSFIN